MWELLGKVDPKALGECRRNKSLQLPKIEKDKFSHRLRSGERFDGGFCFTMREGLFHIPTRTALIAPTCSPFRRHAKGMGPGAEPKVADAFPVIGIVAGKKP